MIHGLDLFSGIGGLTVALEPWVRPIAYCENDRYCQGVLLSRMHVGAIATAPIWDDVRTLNGELLENVDIIYGGFPCQDISSAGLGVGLEAGSRSGLFFEIIRLVEEIRPAFVFLENVPAIRTRGLARVLTEFTSLRYDCRWTTVSAAEIGAPHLRKRWFLLANPMCEGAEVQPRGRIGESRQKALGAKGTSAKGRITESPFREIEPRVGRAGDGIQGRVDRIRALGNAVVPLQARTAFERLIGMEIT